MLKTEKTVKPSKKEARLEEALARVKTVNLKDLQEKQPNDRKVKRVSVLLNVTRVKKVNALNALRVRLASVLLDVKRVRKVNARNAVRVKPVSALKAKKVTVLQDAKTMRREKDQKDLKVMTQKGLHQSKKRKHLI